MIYILLFCPVLFSFLYQFCEVEDLSLKYLFRRSTCDYCHQPLGFTSLIPIWSFIQLRGRSICCHQRISRTYLIGELFALIPIIFFYFTFPINSTSYLLTYLFLLTFAIYDFKTFTLPLHVFIVFSFCVFYLISGEWLFFILVTLLSHLFYFLCHKGIGYGDILIFSILSYILPYNTLVIMLLLTSILATIFGLYYHLCLHQKNKKIPLLPFVFIAFNIAILF
ncbi:MULTISPECIES: prepilin peptidase [Staphylococcus]|uniref:prepilin peptidase n=1 Tax=Staphylococcus TaxID=1279 RepID=UPI003AAE9E6F